MIQIGLGHVELIKIGQQGAGGIGHDSPLPQPLSHGRRLVFVGRQDFNDPRHLGGERTPALGEQIAVTGRPENGLFELDACQLQIENIDHFFIVELASEGLKLIPADSIRMTSGCEFMAAPP
jgi:hypothetical protein